MVRLLARKADTAPALVLGTYRDDELDLRHPLRVVLGELARASNVARCELPRLSPDAVAQLAEPHGIDADELYRRTAGNPFFLSEVLAERRPRIPPTVRDAVLARTARVSAEGAALLGAVSVSQPQAELWLLEALASKAQLASLDECLGSGMLAPTTDGVAFRHELGRMTIEETLAPHSRAALHRDALAALVAPPAGAPDPARLAHHAEAAGDGAAVLEFAPAAAARADSVGAHRQAAAQYARALRFGADLPLEKRVALLEGRFRSAFRADDCDEAIEAMREALAGHRALGDRLREGDRMRRLSDVLFCPGDRCAEAERLGRDAVTVLEGCERARARPGLREHRQAVDEPRGPRGHGRLGRSGAGVRRGSTSRVRVHALNTIGTIELITGDPAARRNSRAARARAEAGLVVDVARGYGHLAWAGLRNRDYAIVDAALAAGLDHCAEPSLDLWRLYLQASSRARSSTRADGPRRRRRRRWLSVTREPPRSPASWPASRWGSCARAAAIRGRPDALDARPRPRGGLPGAAARGSRRRGSRGSRLAAWRPRRRRERPPRRRCGSRSSSGLEGSPASWRCGAGARGYPK